MKLCDFCGFVIKDQDSKCSNCRMMVPGREAMLTPPKVEMPKLESKSVLPYQGISSYIPKKLIALLLVVGLFASPQTQVLVTDGMDYWDQINTPYYTIPEQITLTYVRNFEIFLDEGDAAEYTLTLSVPENRPSGSQLGATDWQIIENLQVSPMYNLTSEGRMEWKNNLTGSERDHISLEYTATINLIRPDIKISNSGKVSDIPAEFGNYLEDDWLIEPSNEQVQQLAL